jgi:excisionase family DNA binding protein
MKPPIGDTTAPQSNGATEARDERRLRKASRVLSGRLLDLKTAEAYSGISAWTLRDLIASGELPVVRPPRLRRVWIDRADLDNAIAQWKERCDSDR